MTESELLAAIADPAKRTLVSASEFVDAILTRIQRLQPRVNAFITVTADLARQDAIRVDSRRTRSRLPLDRTCIAVKDNIDVASYPATAGSAFLRDNVPSRDAEVIARLRHAGAIIVGKTNMHELAFGGTTQNDFYGSCHNPWNLDMIPGGSSGGSGAAVAADLCTAALGTDTGGSVRIPAAMNGVVGLRPSFGRVSTRGVFPLSWSIDTVGALSHSVTEVAAVHRAISAYDEGDVHSLAYPAKGGMLKPMHETRIIIPFDDSLGDLALPTLELFHRAAEVFSRLGATVTAVDLSGFKAIYPAGLLIVGVEARALHEVRLREHPEAFSEGVRRRLTMFRDVTATEYARALEQVRRWRRDLGTKLSTDADLLLTPVCNVPASIAGADTVATTQAIANYTYPVSLARLPAISVPCGFVDGLPVGIQLAAAQGRDELIISAATAYQSATPWADARPALR